MSPQPQIHRDLEVVLTPVGLNENPVSKAGSDMPRANPVSLNLQVNLPLSPSRASARESDIQVHDPASTAARLFIIMADSIASTPIPESTVRNLAPLLNGIRVATKAVEETVGLHAKVTPVDSALRWIDRSDRDRKVSPILWRALVDAAQMIARALKRRQAKTRRLLKVQLDRLAQAAPGDVEEGKRIDRVRWILEEVMRQQRSTTL